MIKLPDSKTARILRCGPRKFLADGVAYSAVRARNATRINVTALNRVIANLSYPADPRDGAHSPTRPLLNFPTLCRNLLPCDGTGTHRLQRTCLFQTPFQSASGGTIRRENPSRIVSPRQAICDTFFG